MSRILGIDTSNYTTSCAVFDSDSGKIEQAKMLLPVRKGEKGLRQSDAVFHHTRQLSQVMAKLGNNCKMPDAVGVSVKPRSAENSYMPCFLAGKNAAYAIGMTTGCEVFETSHQTGHILAALYSADALELLRNSKGFIAFHVSGGTTDVLYCRTSQNELLEVEDICHSLDLKAGQLVDRVGLMLGLDFPCGKQLEKLAAASEEEFHIKPTVRDGCCCLSGVENICEKMISSGSTASDTAKFCLDSIYEAISAMTEFALKKAGDIPVIYAGGVMSDKLIADKLRRRYGGIFAEPEFSCDNAAGVAVFAAVRKGLL